MIFNYLVGNADAIAQRINAAVIEVLNQPDVQKRFRDQGLTPVGGAEAAAFIAEETARWQGVIRTANIRLEQFGCGRPPRPEEAEPKARAR